jgi:hypothetical protein
MANTTFNPDARKETVYSGPAPSTARPNPGTVYNGPGGGTVYSGPAPGGTVYGGAAAGTVYSPQRQQAAAQPTAVNSAGKKGSAYFFAIAIFSAINTLLIAFGSPLVMGTGVTTSKIAAPGQMGAIILFNVLAIGVFVLLGIFARHGSKAAFVIGMVLYGLDTLLLLLGNPALHVPGLVVHGIFLVGLFKAFSSLE